MKELQRSFKKLFSLETKAKEIYAGLLGRKIGDEEIIHKIRHIKREEVGHMLMAKELIKMSARAESRKKKFRFPQKEIYSLEGDIILKRNLLFSMVQLLDAKIRTFTLLSLLGKEAIKFKKADKVRQELTRVIAHQLKTPLATSNWITEIFLRKKGRKLAKDAKEMVEEIRVGNKTMLSFIDDLLEADRIEEAGGIKKTEVDLVSIFKEVLAELKHFIKAQNQVVNFQCFNDKIIIFGEKKSLEKIIFNLLTNAVNYGRNGGLIYIKITKVGANKILFSVSDNGIGIPSAEQKNIFKKFFRASNAKNIYQKGTGLGLHIVKELTKKLGGKVWFKSEENKGTTFYVSLPF